MARVRVIFIAFAIEDERQRDLLVGQSKYSRCPIEFTDMSVKEAYDEKWKERVRTRIRRSNGVIALTSKNSLRSTGQKWELQCAREEDVPILGVHAYSADRTNLEGVCQIAWGWDGISGWIDGL